MQRPLPSRRANEARPPRSGRAKAVGKPEWGSEKGLDAHQILWVEEEFRQMKHLFQYGVNVPKAIAVTGISIIMEFIGDDRGNPAPRISDLKMEKEEAEEAFRQSVRNLQLIVRSGRVHGDYSTFNILWHYEKAVVIDFPQVIEFKNNPNAQAFLERDVHSLCNSFRKKGVSADPVKVLRDVRTGQCGKHEKMDHSTSWDRIAGLQHRNHGSLSKIRQPAKDDV